MMNPSLERARRALVAAGFDSSTPLVRAESNANEAWLGADFVLRVNTRPDSDRLRREAEIARRLPSEARYPGVLGYGVERELEWIVVRRVAGIDLSRAWPELDAARRERAARELAAALRALHGVSEPSLPGDGEFDPPHTLPLEPLLGLFARAQADLDDPALLRELEAFVRRNWAAFDDANVGLVHGDPHLENVVWDGEHVSALIDLEWSRRSWIECDLEILLSFCDHPWFFVAQDYEARALARDYAGVPRWLRDEYPHWFAHPRCADRLAVLHVSRTLGLLHDCPARGPRDPSNLRDRRNHLHALLDNASFLSAP